MCSGCKQFATEEINHKIKKQNGDKEHHQEQTRIHQSFSSKFLFMGSRVCIPAKTAAIKTIHANGEDTARIMILNV